MASLRETRDVYSGSPIARKRGTRRALRASAPRAISLSQQEVLGRMIEDENDFLSFHAMARDESSVVENECGD